MVVVVVVEMDMEECNAPNPFRYLPVMDSTSLIGTPIRVIAQRHRWFKSRWWWRRWRWNHLLIIQLTAEIGGTGGSVVIIRYDKTTATGYEVN